MAKSPGLPMEVHDHFRKANALHGYVQSSLGDATKHALETGQELLAAKKETPPGRWEEECERLFDGSVRTAQFYMSFAKNISALPKAQASALLLLEGTLEGAAKAAKKATNPKPKPSPAKPKPPATGSNGDAIGEETEDLHDACDETPVGYGKCPNCGKTKWDEDDEGVSCAACHHPHGEPAGDVDDHRIKAIQTQRSKTVKTAEALMRAFDDLNALYPDKDHDRAIDASKAVASVRQIGIIPTCQALLLIARGWK